MYYLSITAILVVATGLYKEKFVMKTEIIHLENPSVSCKLWADGMEVYSATGSFTKNGLMICGGIMQTGNNDVPELEVNTCWIAGQNNVHHTAVKQIEASGGSSGVTVNGDSFLLTGGTAPGLADSPYYWNRSEILDLSTNETVYGPDLPLSIAYHCMIDTDDGIFSTGGRSDHNILGIRSVTWVLDKNVSAWQNSSAWQTGPNLIVARHSHACGSFVFENTTILVVTGGTGVNIYQLRWTEFLRLGKENATWSLGK